MKNILPLFLLFFAATSFAQKKSEFNARFESNSQYYLNDIAKNIRDKKFASNNYLDLSYRYRNFEIGGSFESYLPNPLLGYPTAYDDSGLSKAYISYRTKKWQVKVGDFYEQFGSGLIYRSYQEREIGVDQSTFGLNFTYSPISNLRFKLIYGNPNFYFDHLDTKIFGGDVEYDFNIKDIAVNIGGSAIVKKEDYTNKNTTQHDNVKLYSSRVALNFGNFDIKTEYAYKTADANVENNYSRKKGQALQISPSYSKKGFGLNINFRAVQNFSSLTERELDANKNGLRDEDILNYKLNYIPSISQIHSYNIYNIYTYQAKENNEIGYSASLFYKIKKKSLLGGKYGTKLRLNSSLFYTQNPVNSNKNDFLSINDKLLSEHGVQIEKKINRKYKLITEYTYQEYNKYLVEDDLENRKIVKSHIFVADLLTKLNKKHSIKTEFGFMTTKNDIGNWGSILIEYANSKGLSIFASDQYNFGEEKKHYYLIGAAYSHKKSRIALSYGETRDGYTCVGGICKYLPGSKSFSLSLNWKL